MTAPPNRPSITVSETHAFHRARSSERARIRNREIGFIFQAFNLIGDLTVYENVELPLTYRGMGSADRKKRVHEALERVGARVLGTVMNKMKAAGGSYYYYQYG